MFKEEVEDLKKLSEWLMRKSMQKDNDSSL